MNYCKFRELDDKARLCCFMMLMRDGASVWLQTIPRDTIKSLDELIQAFKDNYCRSPELKFQEVSALWSCPQRSDEPFNDDLTRLRRGASRLNNTEETLHYALLNELRPPIKTNFLAQGVRTQQDTIKCARIADAVISTDPISALLTQSIKTTLETADRQAKQIKELTSQVGVLSAVAQATVEAPAYSAPRRPHAAEPRDFRPKYATNQRQKQRPQAYQQPRDYQPRFVKRTTQNLQRANYGQNQARYKQQAPQVNYQPPPPQQDQPERQCTNCGWTHPHSACPAAEQQCGACEHANHFARVCRSVRPPQQQQQQHRQ